MEASVKIEKGMVSFELLDKLEDMLDVTLRGEYIPKLAASGMETLDVYAPELTGNLKRNLSNAYDHDSIEFSSIALDSQGRDYAPIQEHGGESTNIEDFFFAPKRYMEGTMIEISNKFEEAMLEAAEILAHEDRIPRWEEIWDPRIGPNPITGVIDRGKVIGRDSSSGEGLTADDLGLYGVTNPDF